MTSRRHTSLTNLPSENLRRFVATGDPAKARAALRTELNDNRLGRDALLAALAYAQELVEGLCEPYAVRPFADAMDTDPTRWTEAYHDAQLAFLKANFAAERFAHLVEVRLQLRERGVTGFVAGGASETAVASGPTGSPRAPHPVRRLLLAVALCGVVLVFVAALKLIGKSQ
jgi:hypothetical protein